VNIDAVPIIACFRDRKVAGLIEARRRQTLTTGIASFRDRVIAASLKAPIGEHSPSTLTTNAVGSPLTRHTASPCSCSFPLTSESRDRTHPVAHRFEGREGMDTRPPPAGLVGCCSIA